MNFDNELGVIDVQSQQLVAQIPVGNAPFGVVIDGNVAHVCRMSKLVWPEPLTGPALCMTTVWP